MRYSDKIGREIRSVREAKGYSQEYVAEMLDMSQSSYANMESGKSTLSVDRLIRVCKILHINIHSLLDLESINLPLDGSVDEMEEKNSGVITHEVKVLYGELISEMRSEIDFLRSLIKHQTR